MTKTYCDRCEELIASKQHVTGTQIAVDDDEHPEIMRWVIDIRISTLNRTAAAVDWKLCKKCADALIVEAIAQMQSSAAP